MEFFQSSYIILCCIGIALFHILSLLFDAKIPTPVFKISYTNLLLHVLLIALALYESIPLVELSLIFMASVLWYLLFGNIFLRIKKCKQGEEDKNDL